MKIGYLNHFIKLKCAGKFLQDNLYPNVKEITESMAGYYAISQNISNMREGPCAFNNSDVHCLVVGDGGRPRTAALMASMTKWQCYSIDPEMSKKNFSYDRMTVLRKHVQFCKEDLISIRDRITILLLVHSHASLKDCFQAILPNAPKKLHIVTIPCCVKHNLAVSPDIEYRDELCLSPHNLVKIWKNVKVSNENYCKL